MKEGVDNFIKLKFGISDQVQTGKLISKPGSRTAMVVHLRTEEAKHEILRQKKEKLRNENIFIKPDRTQEDQMIFFQLRNLAKQEREAGKTVQIHNRTIKIDGSLFYWDSITSSIQPTSRGKDRIVQKNDHGGPRDP